MLWKPDASYYVSTKGTIRYLESQENIYFFTMKRKILLNETRSNYALLITSYIINFMDYKLSKMMQINRRMEFVFASHSFDVWESWTFEGSLEECRLVNCRNPSVSISIFFFTTNSVAFDLLRGH